ncbi:hypothetical protein ACFV2B_07475 [Streptomyces lavendulae]|uniref:hypothetical protein n=1 Tax=Streptomyces lavendulae TaxID=1914 RepID=UPI00368D064B
MGHNHAERDAARRYAREHGISYTKALYAIRCFRAVVDAHNAGDEKRFAVYLGLKAPGLGGADACTACSGTGVSGLQYETNSSPSAPTVLVDAACGRCAGCGRAEHDGCRPGIHAGEDLDDVGLFDDNDDQDDDEPACPSCNGLRFWYDEALPGHAQDPEEALAERAAERGVPMRDVWDTLATYGDLDQLLGEGAEALAAQIQPPLFLRMPCGCAEEPGAVSVTALRHPAALAAAADIPNPDEGAPATWTV